MKLCDSCHVWVRPQITEIMLIVMQQSCCGTDTGGEGLIKKWRGTNNWIHFVKRKIDKTSVLSLFSFSSPTNQKVS